MSKRPQNDVILRDKRQVTLPREICEQLKIEPGDKLMLYIENGALVAKPARVVAKEALAELRKAFQESDITLDELIKTGRRIRRQLVKKYYGI